VTFLFSDLVDSTLLWEQREREMAAAVARHDLILGDIVSRHAGVVVKFQGDGLMAVFDDADAALRAAVDGQRALGTEDWSVPLGVRMGLCTGTARESGGDYHGQVVNRAARAASAAHPGQIVVAPSTAALVGAFDLRDPGEYRLKGLTPAAWSEILRWESLAWMVIWRSVGRLRLAGPARRMGRPDRRGDARAWRPRRFRGVAGGRARGSSRSTCELGGIPLAGRPSRTASEEPAAPGRHGHP